MAKEYRSSFPPGKALWWERLFRFRKGDIWEQRINEWGVWDEDYLGRWEWDGKEWVIESGR